MNFWHPHLYFHPVCSPFTWPHKYILIFNVKNCLFDLRTEVYMRTPSSSISCIVVRIMSGSAHAYDLNGTLLHVNSNVRFHFSYNRQGLLLHPSPYNPHCLHRPLSGVLINLACFAPLLILDRLWALLLIYHMLTYTDVRNLPLPIEFNLSI